LRGAGRSGFGKVPAMGRFILDSDAALALFAGLARETVEVAAFAFLDGDRRLLGMRHTRSTLRDAADVPIRAVASDALAFGAAAVLMAHNHPSGDPAPTQADHEVTRRLARALEALDVELLDHLVIAHGSMTSFRALGLL